MFIIVIGSGLENRIRFESNMPLAQHKHFNEMLNALVTKSNARGYRGERIHYKHTYETDRFYHPNNNTRTKWRVTTNQQTGQVRVHVKYKIIHDNPCLYSLWKMALLKRYALLISTFMHLHNHWIIEYLSISKSHVSL